MKIALISKSDAAGGGASRVAEQLCAGLRARGHEAVQYVGWTARGFDAVRRPLHGPRLARALTRRLQRVAKRAGFVDLVPVELPAVAAARFPSRYDLVHVHDLPDALSPFTLRYLARRVPTVWTLHDCSPFTGGCLYPLGCGRYHDRCGADGRCPLLGAWPLDTRFDRTSLMLRAKRAVHADGHLRTLAPSEWMADTAFGSGTLPRRPIVVANGVDTEAFAPPADRDALRARLGIPPDRPVVLLSAGWLDDQRKGIRPALAALHAVADRAPFVVLVGGIDERLRTALGALAHVATGFVDDTAALAAWYGSADVFLFCSLADNQPLVILETMACGVPLVGYATGGIPEMVDPAASGLVTPHDARALGAALRRALEPGVAAAWGRASRARVVERFAATGFVERHLALYERTLLEAAAARTRPLS